MKKVRTYSIGSAAVLLAGALGASAQDSPPTYQADPGVYKVIFEDQNFRVIAASWSKGARDKAHSHPVPSVVYAVKDCSLRIHAPDGKTTDISPKAGASMAVPVTPSHSTENVGA